jgi:hypothetical protein
VRDSVAAVDRFEGSFKKFAYTGQNGRRCPWRDGDGALTIGDGGLVISGPAYGWGIGRLLAGVAVLVALSGLLPRLAPSFFKTWGFVVGLLFLVFLVIGMRRRAQRTQEFSWRVIKSAKVSGDGHAVVNVGRVVRFNLKFMPTGGDPHPLTAAISAHLKRS